MEMLLYAVAITLAMACNIASALLLAKYKKEGLIMCEEDLLK